MIEVYELSQIVNEAEERGYKRGFVAGQIDAIDEFKDCAIDRLINELYLDEYKDQIIKRVLNELAETRIESAGEG